MSKSLHFLGYRARTHKEIVDYLVKKGFDESVIDCVCIRLRELGYLDDEAFARTYVGLRQDSARKVSMTKMQRDLMRKGVTKEAAEKAMAGLPGEYEIEAAQELVVRLSAKMDGLDHAVRDRKMIGYLMRRGFSYDVAQSALRQLHTDEM